MLQVSHTLLRALIVLNVLAAFGFAVILVLSFPFEAEVLRKIARGMNVAQPDAVLAAVRNVLLIALGAAAAAHILLDRLLRIVRSVAAGDPFVQANARRLRVIAWALLALQLLDLAFGLVDWRFAQLTDERLGWSLSMTGWIAVVMTFVLARVFAAGAAMRDELASTI